VSPRLGSNTAGTHMGWFNSTGSALRLAMLEIIGKRDGPRTEAVQPNALQTRIFEHRIFRPGPFCGKFIRPSNLQTHAGLGKLEDFTGKLVPGATTLTVA
jgi:hypothetical protein